MASVVSLPHFDLPFRFAADKHAAVTEQDREKDVENCVEAVIRTDRGTRLYVPNFGIDDPTFESPEVDLIHFRQQITLNESRAETLIKQQIDYLDKLISRIRVEVRGQ